jgi:hypothetical protein
LVVEGVLNGGFIAGSELVPEAWDGMPVTIGHPRDAGGTPISAREPGVLGAFGVGQLAHANLGQTQRRREPCVSLRAELYLDVERCETLGGEALQALTMLEAQELLEVSTGFFSAARAESGVFAGVPYQETLHDIVPDHLALLPNQIGACAVSDGCGAPRLHAACDGPCICGGLCEGDLMDEEASTLWRRLWSRLRIRATTEGDVLIVAQTDQDIREALYGALAREANQPYTSIFIDGVDVATSTFTYRSGERLIERGWTRSEEGLISLTEDRHDVQRVTTFLPVPAITVHHQEEPSMAMEDVIKRRVDALIANQGTRWTEDDRHMLVNQDEAFLIRLEAQPRVLVSTTKAPETVQEAIATMPEHLQEPMQAMAQEYEQRKASSIALLAANAQCPFSQEELQAMTAQRLEQLVAMSGVVAEPPPPDPRLPEFPSGGSVSGPRRSSSCSARERRRSCRCR